VKSIIAQLKEKITQYIDTYLKLIKIGFIEGTSNVLSYFIFAFICLFFILCLLLFLGFGIVEVFVMLGFCRLAAFFITSGIYALLLLLILMLRKPLVRFFAGGFIGLMTGGKEDKKSED